MIDGVRKRLANAFKVWKAAFYPWDDAEPAPPEVECRARRSDVEKLGASLADWTLDFALDELQRCYDALGPTIAKSDVRMALPLSGCVADSVDATVRNLRGRIQTLEMENRILRAEMDPDGHDL